MTLRNRNGANRDRYELSHRVYAEFLVLADWRLLGGLERFVI